MTFSYPSGTIIDRIRFENIFFYKGDKSAKKLLIMADQTKIDQFINLTGVDADRARFYIESAGGNVEVFNYPLILNMNVLYVCFDFTIESKTRIDMLTHAYKSSSGRRQSSASWTSSVSSESDSKLSCPVVITAR